MAKQTGLVRYSGTMGGVRHFKIKGLDGDFAGLIGGPTAEQIQNDEAFVRTRENMTEFGGCASVAKSIRVAFAQLMKQMSDPRVAGRLTALMKQINLNDTVNPRGQRGIFVSANQSVIDGFDFDEGLTLPSVFNAPYTLTNTPARNSATLTVPAFNPANLVTAPSGATHFRMVGAIGVVSDWKYNISTGQYEPIDPTLSELSDVQYSGYLDLNAVTSPTTITTNLPGSPTMTLTTSVLSCVGIEFYQAVGSNYYLFSQGNALKVEAVF